jgi:RNA polymerase sigma-70 factor (ECF subfamily)
MHDSDPFPTTRWILLEQARGTGPAGRKALASLLDRYVPALGAYLMRGRNLQPDRADDLLQAFVTEKLLDSSLLARASPERGRFRALLITSLKNFLISDARQRTAQRRDSRQEVCLDAIDDPAYDGVGPAQEYEVEWARTVVSSAASRLRAECKANGREDIWGIFEGRLMAPILGEEPIPYAKLAWRYGLKSPIQAANMLTTAKRMYARVLRQVVAEYEPDEARIDGEIAELRGILAKGRTVC